MASSVRKPRADATAAARGDGDVVVDGGSGAAGGSGGVAAARARDGDDGDDGEM